MGDPSFVTYSGPTFVRIRSSKHDISDAESQACTYYILKDEIFRNSCKTTLKKILYLNPPKHELLNHLLIKSMTQPYYLVDSTKQCDFD